MPTPHPSRQRGITLIEALIAFLILALGMLAIARFQTHLRLNAEIARQRSEAVRLAQHDIEALRAFAALAVTPGLPSFDAITSASNTVDTASGYATNTAYRVTRQVDTAGALRAKTVQLTVDWRDRAGNPQQVVLDALIAGIAPGHSGALGLARSASPAHAPFGRSVHIPLAAHDLGDGRSAFKPVGTGTVAFVFDNRSGLLTGRCTAVAPATPTGGLSAANLGPCDASVGLLLSGVVRFSSAAPPDAARGNDAPPAFTITLATSGSPPATSACSVETLTTPGGDRFTAYHCAVYPASGLTWSGRATLVPSGWTIGTGTAERRVCRYTSDLDRNGAIDATIEHAAAYADVGASLAQQNFLVVGGSVACPGGQPSRVTGNNGDVYVDLSTAQHQP